MRGESDVPSGELFPQQSLELLSGASSGRFAVRFPERLAGRSGERSWKRLGEESWPLRRLQFGRALDGELERSFCGLCRRSLPP